MKREACFKCHKITTGQGCGEALISADDICFYQTDPETGKIFEKYNVINPGEAAGGAVYPDQHGFGWTNGVTYKFIQLLKN